MTPSSDRARQRGRTPPGAIVVDEADASLLDLIDNALNRGIVIEGEVVLGLADVDLIYLRLSILLSAAGRIVAAEPPSSETPEDPSTENRA